MKTLPVPTVATWLLKRFASRNEALAGDLLEEYQGGRSRLWYWRQVLIAVARVAFEDIRIHKMLALRAILIGWSVVWYSQALLNQVVVPLGITASFVIPWSGWLCAGWIVGRLHRPHAAVAMVFGLSVLLVDASPFLWMVRHEIFGGPPGVSLLMPILNLLMQTTWVFAGVVWGAAEREAAPPAHGFDTMKS